MGMEMTGLASRNRKNQLFGQDLDLAQEFNICRMLKYSTDRRKV
jgi:hypothetical protein